MPTRHDPASNRCICSDNTDRSIAGLWNRQYEVPMASFTAKSSRRRIGMMVAVCAGFVALGLWLVGAFGKAQVSRYNSALSMQMAGWLCIGFFGLSGASRLPQLAKHQTILEVSAAGIRWLDWSDATIPWSEVKDVSIWTYQGQKAIVIKLVHPELYPGRGLRAFMNGLNRRFTNGDLVISMNPTDRTFAETYAAISSFRE